MEPRIDYGKSRGARYLREVHEQRSCECTDPIQLYLKYTLIENKTNVVINERLSRELIMVIVEELDKLEKFMSSGAGNVLVHNNEGAKRPMYNI